MGDAVKSRVRLACRDEVDTSVKSKAVLQLENAERDNILEVAHQRESLTKQNHDERRRAAQMKLAEVQKQASTVCGDCVQIEHDMREFVERMRGELAAKILNLKEFAVETEKLTEERTCEVAFLVEELKTEMLREVETARVRAENEMNTVETNLNQQETICKARVSYNRENLHDTDRMIRRRVEEAVNIVDERHSDLNARNMDIFEQLHDGVTSARCVADARMRRNYKHAISYFDHAAHILGNPHGD